MWLCSLGITAGDAEVPELEPEAVNELAYGESESGEPPGALPKRHIGLD